MRALLEQLKFAPRSAAARSLGLAVLVFVLVAIVPSAPSTASARKAICSGPGSAKVPCRFSTPSGNVRCVWTPKPNSVACVLRATGRAYRLRPTGHARAVSLRLARPGKALPLNQQLVFPGSMSCRDTRRSMICNQDFGSGSFTLAPTGSHRS